MLNSRSETFMLDLKSINNPMANALCRFYLYASWNLMLSYSLSIKIGLCILPARVNHLQLSKSLTNVLESTTPYLIYSDWNLMNGEKWIGNICEFN